MKEQQDFELYRPLLEDIAVGIARQFGTNCEVAIHDTTHGADRTIAFIQNGHVTGRKVGDSASETVLKALKDKSTENRYAYVTNSKDGRMLRSSTINIRNADNQIIAVLCINLDISDLVLAKRSLEELTTVDDSSEDAVTIPGDVNNLLDQLIEESHKLIGKPISAMTKEDKMRAIQFLDQKGALLVMKSSVRISEYYGISKYTLYNYLNGLEEGTSNT
jgi:predicted transcriptional regulator YheO